jgi:hypothetical protein
MNSNVATQVAYIYGFFFFLWKDSCKEFHSQALFPFMIHLEHNIVGLMSNKVDQNLKMCLSV